MHTHCLGIPPGIPPPPQLTWCGFEQLLLPRGHNTIGALTVQVHMCMYRCGCARALPGREGAWPQLPATHASHCAPSSRWLPPSSRPKGCPHSRGTSAALLLPPASGGALLIESPPQPLCTPAPASWASHTSVCMHQHLWPHPQTRPPHEHTPGGGSSWRATREQRVACGGGGHWTMCSWLSPQLAHTGSLAPTAGQDGHVCNM